MRLFNKYPWSNFHRMNADWLLETVTDLAERAEAALANVGEWAARIAHAEEKADQAATDAASAAARAHQAQIDADSAAASAAQAAQDAQDAETSAGRSAQSASAAVDLADQAAASASAAQTQATNAATSANAAQTQATNAATSASAAQTQAANAATSAAQAAASAAQAAQAAAPSVSNYNITFAYPVTGGQDVTMPDFQSILADITAGKEIVFNLTFEGDGQGVIDGTARVTGVFADVSQTHMWVYLRVENTLYAVSWFHPGDGTTVYSVYNQTDHNVPPVGNANNGKVLTSHGSYYSWSDVPGPLVVTFSGTDNDSNSACDKTWAEVNAAGKNIEVWYDTGLKLFKLAILKELTAVSGTLTVTDEENTLLYYIVATIDNQGGVYCAFTEN